jgi:hypothetical protein
MPSAFAALSITYGGAGSDGAFAPAEGSVEGGVLTIDLRNALTGDWEHEVTTGELEEKNTIYGRGVYDADKWAVVFKYASVNIPADLTVKFINHPSRAPVVWLVTGDVTIAGTVDLNGSTYVAAPDLSEPGPGGFRGGMAYYGPNSTGSAGLGPGGGARENSRGYGAGHGTSLDGEPTYGNPSLLPLVGGSGGGGDMDTNLGYGGAAGGGAILIATPGTVTVSGLIRANGGRGYDSYNYDRSAGSGSGGGIRLVCSALTGAGGLQAQGGASTYHPGGDGRIRIERISVDEADGSLDIAPTPSVVALADAATPLLWPPADGPTVRVVSIGGVAAPADPRAAFGAAGPDVAIPQTTTTTVVVETVNVEEASSVFVRVAPRASANYTRTQVLAEDKEVISGEGEPLKIRWTATVPVSYGHSAVQVQVVRP